MVAISVLGPMAADVDGAPAELGGPRQRAVLALLLTARGATLSADRMIDDLWSGEPPPSARATLHAYVSHLRRELEPGRSRRAPGRLLVSTPPGYAFRPPEDAVDAWRFERALARARGLLAADPDRARTETAAALRLWRGEAYAEFADAPWAAVETARLGGLRLTARETHAAATLRLGRPAEAVAEAEALTGEEPLREEGWRLLVLALWADGRQADALAALRRVRRGLAEELGIEPGPGLTELEEAILQRRWSSLRVGGPPARAEWGPGPAGTAAVSVSVSASASAGEPDGTGSREVPGSGHPWDGMPPPAGGRSAAAEPAAAGPAGSAGPERAEVPGPAVGQGPGSRPVSPPRGAGPALAEPVGTTGLERGETTGSGPEVDAAPPLRGAASDRPAVDAEPGRRGAAGGPVPGDPGGSGGSGPYGTALPSPPGQPTPDGTPAHGDGLDPSAPSPFRGDSPFVGRDDELAALAAAAGEAAAGAVRFVLVAGEAGAGKSRLLEQCAGRLGDVGWVTAVGRCPEAEGAPPAFAWEEIAGRLARYAPPDPRLADDLAPLLDPGPRAEARRASDRFRLHRACRTWFAAATRDRPLALFLDDLHRADRETLALLAGLAEDPPAGRLLVVAAHRPDEGDLAAVQAVLARRTPVRLPLDGLAPPDAVRLVRALAPVDAGTAAALAERTGGNPFFLLETARMLSGGTVTADALRAVPDGVRAVLRRRFDRLPPAALPVLRLAAVAGPEVDVEVLIRAAAASGVGATLGPADGHAPELAAGRVPAPAREAGAAPAAERAPVPTDPAPADRAPTAPAVPPPADSADSADNSAPPPPHHHSTAEDTVLDALDAGLSAGLLTEPGPGRVRFAHALVRDTLHADTSGLRRARLHTALGRALRELRPDDVTAIAHHHLRAPATATARTAVDYAVRAARLAGRRYAHDTAAELLAQAAACVERHPAAFAAEDAPARLVALLGLQLQARARGGAVVEAQDIRARAMDVAERHGRDDLLVEALTAWTEPTAWERRTYAHEDTRSVAALRRLLADGSLADAARCRLLEALASALDSAAGPGHAARRAAAEAVDLARRLDDPGLLAQVLATRSRVIDWELDAAPREKVAAELAQLAEDHDMPAYAWFADYLAAGTAAVRGDVAAIRRHVARGLEIAETHRLSEPAAVGHVQLAALRMAEGDLAAAERGYAEAVARLRANGSPHAEAMGTVSRFALCWLRGRPADALPELRAALPVYGALAGDSLALALTDAGRPDEARAARAERPPIRQDFFHSLFLTARALAVVALAERDEAADLLTELLPLRDVVAGAASMCLAMRPVAQTLGDLALLLGRTDEADGHYAHAAVVARRWQAPHWLADAENARAALARPR
ncbi:BTAD domain-containing putative transcriptional regulator [Streptomyces sp. MAR4 CNX-425]|uniref:BTAD domain-containing putative transcriptional regulator n=1 Tax=Streptomyces sp. MAR4 CNX-425 TaxID=3406343 RepID=UPI003B501994